MDKKESVKEEKNGLEKTQLVTEEKKAEKERSMKTKTRNNFFLVY
jgi:hypothetical protein